MKEIDFFIYMKYKKTKPLIIDKQNHWGPILSCAPKPGRKYTHTLSVINTLNIIWFKKLSVFKVLNKSLSNKNKKPPLKKGGFKFNN